MAVFFASGCRNTPVIVDRPRPAEGVVWQDVSFHSAALNRSMNYRVYLPAHPAVGKKLPVVYLLHGGGGGYRDWSNDSVVGAYARRGLILVMPEGAFSYFVNAAGKTGDRYEDYLTRDLIADVEARFPAAQSREQRAIVGISMGGYAAVRQALIHPDLYGFAGGLSPAIHAPTQKFSWQRWGQSLRLRNTFGKEGSAERRAADPFVEVQQADPNRTPYLYLGAGQNEALLDPNRRFAAQLKARHFAYEFHTAPGGHDWNQWNAQLPGCMESLISRLHLQP